MYTHLKELERANREMAVLKKLSANNEAEYDRLAKENQKLQVYIKFYLKITSVTLFTLLYSKNFMYCKEKM